MKKYKVNYKVEGAESGGTDSKVFEADNDIEAQKQAGELVAEAEHSCNEKISNPFWHYQFTIVSLFRISQEEISVPIQI